MTMQEQIAAHPEWSNRTHVEAWLTACAREAGPCAEDVLAEFGARLDENGEADISHLTSGDVKAIMAAAVTQ